ncbi:MAG: universal stress protein [Methanomicrobiales archaeon]|nr:universal stress protein [Methanomicrobiales archaeon]
MFRKILVAVDGSPITGNVLAAAADLAKHYEAELHCVYVIETGWSDGDVARELVIRELEEESGTMLAGFERDLTRMGASADMHLRRGHPGETILDAAHETGSDLVVIGSVGRSQISRMLSGSVSTFVVAHSPVATLVVKP